jgi:hypothetical protein
MQLIPMQSKISPARMRNGSILNAQFAGVSDDLDDWRTAEAVKPPRSRIYCHGAETFNSVSETIRDERSRDHEQSSEGDMSHFLVLPWQA